MAVNYLTLSELEVAMGSSWDDSLSVQAERLIEIASAGLRQVFRNFALDLDARLLDGSTEEVLVRHAVAEMVSKALLSQSAPFGGDFTQLSESAGGYSISVTGSGQSMFLRRETGKWLGLPSLSVGTLKLI